MQRVLVVAAATLAASSIACSAPPPSGDTVLLSSDQQRILHVSGMAVPTTAATPAEAAKSYLSAHGQSYGLTSRQELRVISAPAPHAYGAVRLRRFIDGFPVVGGDLVVALDARQRVVSVNAGDVPSSVSGRHVLDADAARNAAAAHGGRAASASPVWLPFADTLRAAYQVDLVTSTPAGEWRLYVDAVTGKILLRKSLRRRATAPASVFEISPVESAAALCPLSGSTHQLCTSPVEVTLRNLVSGASLVGTNTSVRNCRGGDAPADPTSVATACSPVDAVTGSFRFPLDATYISLNDDFAATMAYYQLDRHVAFFRSLDPTTPPGPGHALSSSLPAFVNVTEGGQPFENAYYSSYLGAMVFGQGAAADFAYDATVMFHELTHGVVDAWGDFNDAVDTLGTMREPGAVNEGTADAMASAETGRSTMGAFLGATMGQAALRDLADPDATRTCRGSGRIVTQFGAAGVVDGLDGEVHDDGEIWNGFYWEVSEGLRRAHVKACSGACDGAAALQYAAIQLAGGTSPGLGSYWRDMKTAATQLFTARPEVAQYVECVAKRRALDHCDRTVPVYSGERKTEYIDYRYSPFQLTFQVTGAAQIQVCSASGSSTTLYLRRGAPVQLSGIDPQSGDAVVIADRSIGVTQACQSGRVSVSLQPQDAGAWYALLDSTIGPPYWDEVFLFSLGNTGFTTRPAAAAPVTCAPPFVPLSIRASSTTVPPRGTLTLGASGGSETGYAWTASCGSGGSVSSGGVYSAGTTGGVTDRVQLADDAGNHATVAITVSAGVSISPASSSVRTGSTVQLTAAGGSGSYQWSVSGNPGSSITQTGLYTADGSHAGPDAVTATDSLGNAATATIDVTAPPGSGGCSSGATGDLSAVGLGVAAFALRRRRPRRRGSRSVSARAPHPV